MEDRMTAQKLKNSILQMAVQGKLVPQDPNDEPASVLLERIRKEKEQLIKEGKIKRNKNESYIFRGADNLHYEQIDKEVKCIEDELPFEIPDSWKWIKLGYISTYEQTKAKIKSSQADPNIWELNLEDIEKGGQLLQKKSVQECKSKGDKTIFHIGDILYSKLRPYLLKIIIADEDGICTSEIVPFRLYGNIYSKYIVYTLKSPFVDSYINSVTYGVKMPRAGTDTMINLYLPLPPLSEQHRIVAKLQELEPLIEKYRIAEEQLHELNSNIKEQLKKSILQYAIEGKLVPQDPNDEPASVLLERIRKEKEKLIVEGKIKKDKNESIIYRRDNSYYEKQGNNTMCIDDKILFDIPLNWMWSNIGSVCLYSFNGKTPKYVKENNGNLTLGQAANQNYGINYKAVKFSSNEHFYSCDQYQFLKENDTLLNTLGGGSVGRVGIFKNPNNYRCITDGHIFVFRTEGYLDEMYLYLYMKSQQVVFEKMSEGTTNQSFLKLPIIKKYLIPVPPLEEQRRIVYLLEKIFYLLA